jgi:hypothetical protein
MSRKSAVSEYQALELKGGFCSRKETSNAKAKRQPAEAKRERELVKLWPEVQQECRDGYREWIKEHSKADDRVQGIKMLQALIERLQKFGFDQKAKRFEQSLFCSDAEGVPSLLDRLRFPRDDGDEFEEWQGVNDAIVGFLASELGAKKPDALQLASALRERLQEITKQQTAETRTKGQSQGGKPPKKWTQKEIDIWNMWPANKPHAIVKSLEKKQPSLTHKEVVSILNKLKRRVRRGNGPSQKSCDQ